MSWDCGDLYGNRKSNLIFRCFRSLAVNPLFMRVWDTLQFLPFCVIRGFWSNCSGQTADKIYKTHSQKRNRSEMIGSFLWTWIYFQTKNFFYTLFARNTTRKNAADSLKSESVYSLTINSFTWIFLCTFHKLKLYKYAKLFDELLTIAFENAILIT